MQNYKEVHRSAEQGNYGCQQNIQIQIECKLIKYAIIYDELNVQVLNPIHDCHTFVHFMNLNNIFSNLFPVEIKQWYREDNDPVFIT